MLKEVISTLNVYFVFFEQGAHNDDLRRKRLWNILRPTPKLYVEADER
jgi:hypothetical protein